jgi:hypothetical protein
MPFQLTPQDEADRMTRPGDYKLVVFPGKKTWAAGRDWAGNTFVVEGTETEVRAHLDALRVSERWAKRVGL